MSQNTSHEFTLLLENIGEIAFTGIDVEVVDNNPENHVTAIVSVPETNLMPSASMNLVINVTAGSDAFYDQFTIKVNTDQKVMEESSLIVQLREAIPVVEVTPQIIEIGINPGNSVIKDITIHNSGFGTMENVRLSQNSLPWLNIISPIELGDIPPANESLFAIELHPDDSIPIGIFSDKITISSDNHHDIIVDFRIRVTTSEKGNLAFVIKDAFNRTVESASVRIQHQN